MGKISKVVVVDEAGGPIAASGSTQVSEDPVSYTHGLKEPPYKLEMLLALAEIHPVHGSALDQKAADIAATGWEWEVEEHAVKQKDKVEDADPDKDKSGQPDDSEKFELNKWLNDLVSPDKDETFAEVLSQAWSDVETFGHGCIEIARDGGGTIKNIYSMPAQTTRFASDGIRMAQAHGAQRVWFKRWLPGNDIKVNRKTGSMKQGKVPVTDEANEILVLRRPSRRSPLYGVPTYVTSIGWINLSLAARDDNIHFFNNRREPRWAVVLQNIDEDQDLESTLQEAFAIRLKQPHKNIFIPIEGDGKVVFQKLSEDTKDMSFEKLQDRADSAILMAHKTPPERLGLGRVGPLGGNAVQAASRVYKAAVVAPSQELLATRLNRFIKAECPLPAAQRWRWVPKELDVTEEAEDVDVVVQLWTANLITLNQAIKRLGFKPVNSEEGDKRFHELAPASNGAMIASQASKNPGARTGAVMGAEIGRQQGLEQDANQLKKMIRDAIDEDE